MAILPDTAAIRVWHLQRIKHCLSKKHSVANCRLLDKLGAGWWFADTYIKNDILSIEESIVNHVEYTMARSRYKFDDQEAYMATAYSLRDRLIESWNDTQAYFKCVP